MPGLEQVGRLLRALERVAAGKGTSAVRVSLESVNADGVPVRAELLLPVTGAGVPVLAPAAPACNGPAPAPLSDAQRRILTALEGHALRSDDLASAASMDRRTLFKSMPTLKERGLVGHDRRGYFRPDAPP